MLCVQILKWWLVLLVALTGCGAPAVTPTPTPHGIVDTTSELTPVLRERGFVVQDGDLSATSFLSVWVWEFETLEDADVARLFIDGEDSPLARVDFSATPRFLQNGQMMVLFVDTNRPVLNALIAVLGNPFL